MQVPLSPTGKDRLCLLRSFSSTVVLERRSEPFASPLRAAGVAVTTVRYDGIIHDFMMLNPLSGTHATRCTAPEVGRYGSAL